MIVLWRLLEILPEETAVYNLQSCADRNKKVNLVYKNEHWVVGIRVTAQGGSDFEESPWTYNRDLKCV